MMEYFWQIIQYFFENVQKLSQTFLLSIEN